MKPAPMPWILWGPGEPPDKTGLSLGSTATTCTGFFDFRNSPVPVIVPPVPMPLTKTSTCSNTLSSFAAHPAGHVASCWGLDGFGQRVDTRQCCNSQASLELVGCMPYPDTLMYSTYFSSMKLAWPAESAQISGPVVILWMSALAGFSNCCRT